MKSAVPVLYQIYTSIITILVIIFPQAGERFLAPSTREISKDSRERRRQCQKIMLALLVALTSLTPPAGTRRVFLGHAAAATFVSTTPLVANAAADCMKTCLSNCARNAPGSGDYCKESCNDYCGQDDRKDGLSGSISTEGAEFGFASSFKLPGSAEGIKPTIYGDDKPPGLPDVFGVNSALRKAVTGGDLTGGVQGQGGAGAAATGLFDANRFRAK